MENNELRYKGSAEFWIDKTGFSDGHEAREPPTFESDVGRLLTDIDRQFFKIARQGVLFVVQLVIYGGILKVSVWVFVGVMSAVFTTLGDFYIGIAPSLDAINSGGKTVFGCLFLLGVVVCLCKAAECD